MSKRGESIWKRKNGRWEGRFIKARNAAGKAIYGSVYAKTYTEVKRKREQAIEATQHPKEKVSEQHTQMSINAVIDEFLAEHRFAVKKSTYARYFEIFEAHLKPDIGEQEMAKFTQEKASEYAMYLLSDGKKSGGGLAPKTVKDILGFFKLDEVGDAAPCRIAPAGFSAPPPEPDGHLSAYPALHLLNLGLNYAVAVRTDG